MPTPRFRIRTPVIAVAVVAPAWASWRMPVDGRWAIPAMWIFVAFIVRWRRRQSRSPGYDHAPGQ